MRKPAARGERPPRLGTRGKGQASGEVSLDGELFPGRLGRGVRVVQRRVEQRAAAAGPPSIRRAGASGGGLIFEESSPNGVLVQKGCATYIGLAMAVMTVIASCSCL